MECDAQVASGKSRKLPKTFAGEIAGRRTEMITARGSVGAAFSSSSLSLPASVDTFSAVLHLRAPRLVARSPSLLKANQGIAEAAAIRGAVRPCILTLRGKRQTREQDDAARHEGGGGRAATAGSSPKRPPYRVDIGQGYSPRLRTMGGEEFMNGGKATKVTTEPLSPTSRPDAAFTSAKDAACGGAAAIECNAMALRQQASYPCQDRPTASERDLLVDSAAEANETTANPARGSRGRATTTPESTSTTRERPMTTSRTDCLCGRLWTGTTASPKSETVRPRTLFLVSGQQQHFNDPARIPYSERRRHQHNVRSDIVVIPLPPPTTAVPRGRNKTTASCGWRWGRAICNDVRIGQEVENKGREGEARGDVLSPAGSSCGLEADEECYDAKTTAATDGKGDDSARRVLHVRVPHLPPTSLLVLRSAPPTTS